MGKKIKPAKKAKAAEGAAASEPTTAPTLIFGEKHTHVDPVLASLFANSAGPVTTPKIIKPLKGVNIATSKEKKALANREVEDSDRTDEEPEATSSKVKEVAIENDEEMLDSSSEEDIEHELDNRVSSIPAFTEQTRKRKRKEADDSLEELYLKKIAKEEEKERRNLTEEKRAKLNKTTNDAASDAQSGNSSSKEQYEEQVPLIHESVGGDPGFAALEKSTRTVFLGNVPSEVIKSKSAKKTLLTHLSSFFPSLPTSPMQPKIESIRFRSTAFATASVPKRAAFAKKELMDSTTKSTNAYIVYNTAAAAQKALSLNGTIVLGRHLRVDSISQPAPVDNKRCVFIGNLGFVDEEQMESATEDGKKQRKPKPPADVEEGLWRIFNEHAGPVESVRVVRDPSTRVGKGFAYVQFHDQNGVEAALLLDGKTFPPMLPRKLRVNRAKRPSKKRDNISMNGNPDKTKLGQGDGLKGRGATRLLGRAGAVQARSIGRADKRGKISPVVVDRTPFVFEGHRAVEGRNGGSLKARQKKTRGRPTTRSARRAKMYKDSNKAGK
ncbi:Nucleolar protein 12 [Ophidiomyces ophidiicola]|uniref:Nucleolar protein 12 n=1 Tax=Ophidiomyces ophidiicola TaxID=1387563 RepID=UPI0020C37C64|nr:Nucleolar protein 12 [Ophidiomyces ophidiicola]KAI1946505.1 Nucleolar protein 12 [Ophidiomyces ophidiicola]KAI2048360.1 Nucleolar protein 12 [Ophidiomyces ophidiicola]